MFIHDGFVCGSATETEMLKITSVKVLKDRMMLLTFSNGETRLFDSTVLNGPAFLPLEDMNIFSNPKIVHGVVTWKDEEIDCAPEYMYEKSFEYNSNDIFVAQQIISVLYLHI